MLGVSFRQELELYKGPNQGRVELKYSLLHFRRPFVLRLSANDIFRFKFWFGQPKRPISGLRSSVRVLSTE